MGVRYFCDRCEKEFKSNGLKIPMYARDALGMKIVGIGYGLLCEECSRKFHMIEDRLEDEEDFFTMTDDDISVMQHSLKEGIKIKDLVNYCQEINSDCGICKHQDGCDNFSRFLSEDMSPAFLMKAIEKNIKF